MAIYDQVQGFKAVVTSVKQCVCSWVMTEGFTPESGVAEDSNFISSGFMNKWQSYELGPM